MTSIEAIIPVYNGEKFISQAIESVLRQSFPVNKLWVVNDGSTDQTGEIIEHWSEKNDKVKVIHQENKGVSFALNEGLKHITSEWLAFLDADDLWKANRLSTQMNAMKTNPDVAVFFGLMKEFEDFSEGNAKKFAARPQIYAGIHRSTMLCKSSLFSEFGGFDESLELGEFIQWFADVRRASQKYLVIQEVLAQRRIHGDNLTASIDIKDYLQLIRRELNKKRKSQ